METAATLQSPPGVLNETLLCRHAYALEVSGYTVLPQQVGAEELSVLRGETDEALDAAFSALRAGRKLKYLFNTPYYGGTRCMYCWGDGCLRLLDLESIHALAAKTMGSYWLWDQPAVAALPTPRDAKKAATGWHRDFGGMLHGTRTPAYLWFFLCLDDTTPENGATWVVPGSHRADARFEPVENLHLNCDWKLFPTRTQVCARAGDMLVMNPTVLHSSGDNHSAHPRRLLNVGVCSRTLRPLLNHWAIAGEALQSRVSARVAKFMGAEDQHRESAWEAPFGALDTTWTLLPEGWNEKKVKG